MLFALWSPKGGSGTSVVSAALAVALSRRRPVLLADLAGDLPAILGLAPERPVAGPSPLPYPSLLRWLAAGPVAESDALDALTCRITDRLDLLPLGSRAGASPGDVPPESGAALAAAFAGGPAAVVDAGRAEHPFQRALVEVADASVVVIRGCYLALRRAVDDDLVARAAGVVVLTEPERALAPSDVADILGAPVLAAVEVTPKVARAVDAGVLLHRPPRGLSGPARAVAGALVRRAPGFAA